MSAATVNRWLSAHAPLAAAVGRFLTAGGDAGDRSHVTPARADPLLPRVCASLASSGRSVLHRAASHTRDANERCALRPLLPLAGRAPPSEGWWEDGWYCCNFSRHGPLLDDIARDQRIRYGRLNIASLLATPVLGHSLLLCADGRELSAADLPGLACTSASVGDLVDIQWLRPRVARFRFRRGLYPFAEASGFRVLCDLLVFTYPDLIAAPADPAALVERTSSRDTWSLRLANGAIHLCRTSASQPTQDLGAVESVFHAQVVARRATGRRRVHFAPHPLLSAALPLWGSVELFSRRRMRALVAKAALRRVEGEHAARDARARQLSPDFADALRRIDWATIFNLPDSSSRQRLLFLKIKGLRLSGWDAANNRRGCPHCAESGSEGGSTYHIVWDCPSARYLWSTVRSWWASLGLWTREGPDAEREFTTAVFSLRLPRTPPKVWAMAPLSQRPSAEDAPEGPYPAVQAAWQQIVLETFMVIMGWRHSRYDPQRAWSDTQAAAVHAASCQRVLATLAHRRATDATGTPQSVQLLSALQELFRSPPPTDPAPPTPAPEDIHVLFFDGGSRGNPGPGGSGACVVRVAGPAGDATVVWSASMSKAHRSTTNNQAEYHGLLAGLRAAKAHGWTNLEVIGDSALILRQLRDNGPPKNAKLLRLYAQARRLADQLDVRHWTHHVRAHNKMADSLANLAMDARTSTQVLHPTARSGHDTVHVHLSNDLGP